MHSAVQGAAELFRIEKLVGKDGATLVEIAKVVGRSVETVRQWLNELSAFAFAKAEPERIVGKDGKSYPTHKPRPPKTVVATSTAERASPPDPK